MISFTDSFESVINGLSVSSPNTQPVFNPANKQIIAQVPIATQAQLDDAVGHAATAFKKWSKLSEDARGAIVSQLGDLLESKSEEFKSLLTKEQGKPVGSPSPSIRTPSQL